MVSVYGYLTLENLELFTGIDYSTIDSTRLTDATVEMNITTAEELINGFLGVSTAQTVTNAIAVSTKFLAGWLLNSLQESLGYSSESPNPIFLLSWIDLINLVKNTLEIGDQENMVLSIPMSGASYHKPDSRFII